MSYLWQKCQEPPVGGSSKTSKSQPTGKDTRGVRWKMYSVRPSWAMEGCS